jgi:predicted RNA binding protein YcfA (HicA-like mRNA interferase family)
MIKEIEGDGWCIDRQRGSHRQFRHPTKSRTVTVPAKIFDDLQRPLIATIVKQVGLERKSR